MTTGSVSISGQADPDRRLPISVGNRYRKLDSDDHLCVWTRRNCGYCSLIIGFLLFIGGLIGMIVAPIVTKVQMQQNIPLTEHSFAANKWIDPPFQISMQFWMFNVTNVQEVLAGTGKPSLREKGPYGYRQTNQKRQLKYGNADNVSYINVNEFQYDPKYSCDTCLESDVFTFPNAVYMAITEMLRYKDETTKRMANMGLLALAERPFVTKSVSQLMLGGYQDQLIAVANSLGYFVPGIIEAVKLPKIFQYFPKNNTDDGRYEIQVGGNDFMDVGKIISWNGMKTLNWWSTPQANMINGTDASLFPGFLKRDDLLPVFFSDMCRSAYLRYYTDVSQFGMNTYRYVLGAEAFNTNLRGNEGFCTKTLPYYPSLQGADLSCLPPGLLNLSSCRGFPAIISMPHFLHAHQDVISSVRGLKPNVQDHQAIFDIQPTFGAAVNVETRFQISVPIYPDEVFTSLNQVKPTIIPMFWFNATGRSDTGTADYLYQNIVVLQFLGYFATFLVLCLGLLLVVLTYTCYMRYRDHFHQWSMVRSVDGYTNRGLVEETQARPDEISHNHPGYVQTASKDYENDNVRC